MSYNPLTLTNSPTWQKITIPYTTIQTAALTNAVNVFTLQAKQVVHATYLNVTTGFSGTTTLTLSLGPSGSLTKFVAATSALSTGAIAGALTSPDLESVGGTTIVQLNAIATVQNLSSLTQGSVDVYLLGSQLP